MKNSGEIDHFITDLYCPCMPKATTTGYTAINEAYMAFGKAVCRNYWQIKNMLFKNEMVKLSGNIHQPLPLLSTKN